VNLEARTPCPNVEPPLAVQLTVKTRPLLFVECDVKLSFIVACAVLLAIECAGSALPNLANAQSTVSHTSTFPYGFLVPYSCPGGSRFEDGRTNMLVTCSDYGWSWPVIVTSCARERSALTDTKHFVSFLLFSFYILYFL